MSEETEENEIPLSETKTGLKDYLALPGNLKWVVAHELNTLSIWDTEGNCCTIDSTSACPSYWHGPINKMFVLHK